MTIRACIAALICFANASWSAPVPVRTGEHVDFTRVVFRIPAGADWRIGRVEAGYAIDIAGSEGFLTSGFFDLIPRDRITGISQIGRGNRLVLETDCLCYANAFLSEPEILVVDIASGPPAPDSPFEAPIGQDDAGEIKPRSTFSIPQSPLLPLVPTIDEPVKPQPVIVDQQPPDEDQSMAAEQSLREVQATVTESVSAALAQGFLEADDQIGGSSLDVPTDEESEAPGIILKTGVDPNAVASDRAVSATQTGRQCAPDKFFAIADWGNDAPFAMQVSAARGDLTGEFDRPDEDAVTALARQYVYFGFGREAVQVLALDSGQSQERRFINAMARIIDGDPVDASVFAEQVSCETDVALWAFLAQDAGPRDATVDVNAILRAYRDLPSHLHGALSARLAQLFLNANAQDAALKVLDLRSAEQNRTAEIASAEANLTADLGDEEAAAQQLAEIAREDYRAPPETMVALFDAGARRDITLTTSDFELGAAMQFELKGEEAALEIAVAQIGAHLSLGNHNEALKLIDRIATIADEDLIADLNERYAIAAVAGMADPTFLEFAFVPRRPGVSEATKQDIEARLDALGFGPVVREMEKSLPAQKNEDDSGSTADTRSVAMPSANQEDGAGVMGPPADTAPGISSDGNDDMRWRTGDWEGLMESDDPLLRSAANLATETSLIELDPETPLASGRQMISEASAARETVQGILDRFASPSDTQ